MKSNKKSQFLLILVIFIIILICYTSSLRKFSSINVNGESNEENNFNLKSSNQKVFSIIADPPDSENWTAKKNNAFPIFPDNFGIDSEGCYISHEWDESVNASRNTPSIHWERNVSIFEDMSYFKITSASVNAIVNATVHANNGINAGVDCPGDSVDQGFIFDYIRFYILISDLEKVQNYEIASFQTIDLGDDTAGTYDILPDTFMNTVSQEALEFYIGNVLETDHHNFTITLGMRIYCEDNYLLDDIDYWDNLRIKSFNLTFTYEKIALFIINKPESGQVFGEIAPEYNLYIVDGNLDTMWYSLDEGFTNITFTELTGTINQTEWNKV
ncbi:MAG: hypothetical protein ACFFB6_04435, partial [Promethearchaeota archaeon]